MSRATTIVIVVLVTAISTSFGWTGHAQTPPGELPSLVFNSFDGADTFRFSCAPCHGRGGRGDGPVAEALKSHPADLSTIAMRNGGIFPRARIESFITSGRDAPVVAAHGTGDMPVWGPTFRSLDPSAARVKARIANVVDHIESLQRR